MKVANRYKNETWANISFPNESVIACSEINIQYSPGCLSNFKVRLTDIVVCVKT